MKFVMTSKSIDKIQADLLVLLQFADEMPFHGYVGMLDWRINGRLSRFTMEKKFKANAREALLMPSEGRLKAKHVIVLGLGARDAFEPAFVGQVLDHMLKIIADMKVSRVCFSVGQILPGHFEWRNAVRLLQSKLFDYKEIEEVILCETEDCLREAKKRQMDFTPQIQVDFV